MTIDKEKLKALAEAAIKQHQDWVSAGEPWPVWNSCLMEMYGVANPSAVLALLAELKSAENRLHDVAVLCATVEQERDQLKAELAGLRTGYEAQNEVIAGLKAENEALKAMRLYWVTAPGNGLIRCVSDDRYRKFAPSIRARYSPVSVKEDEGLRKDAERYRFVRNPIGNSSPLAIWNEGKMPLFGGMADAVVDEFMVKETSHG